ncbi:ParB/RepB/Spo0J family partition protein [Candidatus Saccharibacteria bacterium]|nr:ParB/RepB/Spo0J family partition protein [Candidatus Saccharibacteria bacterium]
MSAKKTGLGRGFESLLPSELLDESFDPTADQDGRVSDLRLIAIHELSADADQPRRHFDEARIDDLAESIGEHGIIQPIVVTPKQGGGYTIVAGERRFRAAQKAGLDKVPSLVRTLNAQHKLEISLIENLQRTDLNAIETATAYLKLRDQFNLTMEEIGKRVGGRSHSTITNTIRLLRLPAAIKQAVAEGKVTEGQVRPLINLEEKESLALLPRIVAGEWSARRVEQEVSILRQAKSGVVKQPKEANPEYVRAAEKIEKHLSVPVKINQAARGGSIVIKFRTKTELDALMKQLS